MSDQVSRNEKKIRKSRLCICVRSVWVPVQMVINPDSPATRRSAILRTKVLERQLVFLTWRESELGYRDLLASAQKVAVTAMSDLSKKENGLLRQKKRTVSCISDEENFPSPSSGRHDKLVKCYVREPQGII